MYSIIRKILLFGCLTLFFLACQRKNTINDVNHVIIQTSYGDMKIRLYDETPLHKQNFLKLTQQKYFNELLFHRVIKDFMIQGGDPESKNAPKTKILGNGGPKYTIPAEFNSNIIHKKGVLAAAREGDNINPEKASSGSQFYLVQGKKWTEEDLNKLLDRKKNLNVQRCLNNFYKTEDGKKYQSKVTEAQNNKNYTLLNELNEVKEKIVFDAKNQYSYTPEQIETYKTIGGTPHLDGDYTVFGEVIEGIEVIDSIAKQATSSHDRPIEDIKMNIILSK